jgi:hypothetical protein
MVFPPEERNSRMDSQQSEAGSGKRQGKRIAAELFLFVLIALGILFWGNYAQIIEPLGIAGGAIVILVYLFANRYLEEKYHEDARREKDAEYRSGGP